MNSRRPKTRGTSSRPPVRARSKAASSTTDPRLKSDSARRTIVIGGGSKPRAFSTRLLAVAFFAILAIIIVTPTLNNYLEQQQQLRSLKASVEEAEARNAELANQVALWNDPEYVKIQARERLGYVMPGEVLYTVTDPDVGSAQEQREALEEQIDYNRRASTPWFVTAWDSITVAGYADGGTGETVVPGDERLPQENE